ncbi:hypothetical protein FRC14_002405 [Serendipita sp. 396]|nr:hypothetical protein FRC14_002405 [Serendipita sp. 396]KAG8784565.1 hypothetical protein FRC15_003064 [Serendipita sp. 397]KAG8800514.1 hypothetical protein FRC16_002740 [Serendipita sp. 398]KAG8865585.1 hypothetical protein FRC20_009677 [Serendipita sp. 405]
MTKSFRKNAVAENLSESNRIQNRGNNGWELYNFRTGNIDQELIKEWNDNLSNLLIFAALYSAILAAFVIESMKKLEEDPQETARDLLMYIANQTFNAARNRTLDQYEPTHFSPEKYIIIINGLLFASLSLGLVVGLVAIIILQWIIRYDSGLLRKNAKDRATTRQYRLEAMEYWQLPRIIALLPILLYASFTLFFSGLLSWLWHINQRVFWAALVIFCIGLSFYLGTTVLAVIWNSAPFDTPVSDGLGALFTESQEEREKDAILKDENLEVRTLLDQLESIEIKRHFLPDLSKTLSSFLQLPKPSALHSQEVIRRMQEKWTGMFRNIQTLSHFPDMNEEHEQDAEIFSESTAILLYPQTDQNIYFKTADLSDDIRERLITTCDLICSQTTAISSQDRDFLFCVALRKQYYMSFYNPLCPKVLETVSQILEILLEEAVIPDSLVRDISTIMTSVILGICGKDRPEGLYLPQLSYDVLSREDSPRYEAEVTLWGKAVASLYATLGPIERPEDWKSVTWHPLRLIRDLPPDIQQIDRKDKERITQILRRIFADACMKLGRANRSTWKHKLWNIGLLIVPDIQREFKYVMLPELLVASIALAANKADVASIVSDVEVDVVSPTSVARVDMFTTTPVARVSTTSAPRVSPTSPTRSHVEAHDIYQEITKVILPFLDPNVPQFEKALDECLISGCKPPSDNILGLLKRDGSATVPPEDESLPFSHVEQLISLESDPQRQGRDGNVDEGKTLQLQELISRTVEVLETFGQSLQPRKGK